MTYEEYADKVISSMKGMGAKDDYLRQIHSYIKQSYDTDVRVSSMAGEDRMSPSGCVTALIMFYPEVP